MVDFRLVRKLLPFTFIGSMLGTLALYHYRALYVKPIIIRITRGRYIICSL